MQKQTPHESGRADTLTPAMITAGVAALQDFGTSEDVSATDPALVVCHVFAAMRGAGAENTARK